MQQARHFEDVEDISRVNEVEAPPRILAFRAEPDIRAERDIEQIALLRSQLQAVREELSKAQRKIEAYEQLLKNARQRESEMRITLQSKK